MKNTLFLYLRMIIVMGINFYVVRAILDLLGIVDYGIYNVVGGVVAMFSFINGTLSTASQRFFSIELAKGDYKKLNQWFSLSINTFSLFIIIFLIVAETIGLWFLNNKLTIPIGRLYAANFVYQLSIISFCINLFSIPYNALIIAHERMSAFAYISIVEAALKLVIVLLLSVLSWDKLIMYGFLTLFSSLGITLSYIVFNRVHFKESIYKYFWNSDDFRNLLKFSGWHVLGTFSVVIRGQGINILINMFFNPAVNAARAISFQIDSAVSQLSNNFFVAVKPEIYKSYALSDFCSLYKLINYSTIICVFLVSVLNLPIIYNAEYVLGLWLKDIPEMTFVFTKLVLINSIIEAASGPTICSALATGNVKKFYIYTGGLYILNLPISYMFLYMGFPAWITMVISIIISLLTTFVRAFLLMDMIRLQIRTYIKIVIKIILVTSIICVVLNYLCVYLQDGILKFAIVMVCSIILHTLLYVVFLFRKYERLIILDKIREKLKR